MIHIYFTNNISEWTTDTLQSMLLPLPDDMQEKILAYRDWQDRQSRIISKHLLLRLLEHFEIDLTLADIKYTKFHKPILTPNPSPKQREITAGDSSPLLVADQKSDQPPRMRRAQKTISNSAFFAPFAVIKSSPLLVTDQKSDQPPRTRRAQKTISNSAFFAPFAVIKSSPLLVTDQKSDQPPRTRRTQKTISNSAFFAPFAVIKSSPLLVADQQLSSKAKVHFSTAHSGSMVVCAVALDVNIGIDIEQVLPIALDDYREQLTENEWNFIQNSSERLLAFYQIWTKKEALLKALGRGVDLEFNSLDVCADTVNYDGENYFFYPLTLAEGYMAHIATSAPFDSGSVSSEMLSDLL
jgi:phosphopantetheinyl transferase